jgi:hypothetical protein
LSSIFVGDTLFNADGRPGVVVGKNRQEGDLLIQRQGEQFDAARRRGYINGLPPEGRKQFNEIIDKLLNIEDSKEKVSVLSAKIQELKEDPRNHLLTKYLEGELAYLMNSSGIFPKEYKISETDIK